MNLEKATTFFNKRITLICPCHFGIESVLKKEIRDLGYDVTAVKDGRVSFEGDWEAVCYANMFLRTAERVLIKAGSFHAETFEDLFQGTRSIEWERFFPRDAKFWVAKASSVRSKLFSPRDIQSVMKKAMVERMSRKYNLIEFPETGVSFPLRVTVLNNEVTVGIDTSGVSLHKRGYRLLTAKAPISECLASALIMLSSWKNDRTLIDPFCGSGTIPIEAALIASCIAPGMNRDFLAESWDHLIPKKMWYNVVDDARSRIKNIRGLDIRGSDIDPQIVIAAKENARNAGVENLVSFKTASIAELNCSKKYGCVVTNPPYGERLEEKRELPALYREMGRSFSRLDSWSWHVITSYEQAEKYIGRRADRNRKIYNGMIKTYFYQFYGPRLTGKGKQR